MRLKKLLTLLLSAAVLTVSAAIPANAATTEPQQLQIETRNGQGQGPNTRTWDILVLVLPDVSINKTNTTEDRYVTNMNFGEIQQVTQLAEKLETYSTNNIKLNVDVKVDYQDITSLTFGYGYGRAILPSDISTQIANNSILGQYDSILTVYRDKDTLGNTVLGSNHVYLSKSDETNNATYAVYPIDDNYHTADKLYKDGAEQLLLSELLDSAHTDMRKYNATIPYGPMYNESRPAQSYQEFMKYMNSDISNDLRDFTLR